MEPKTTDDLNQELMSDAGIDTYIKDNQALFSDKGLAELLTELCERHPVAKNALARKAGMSEVYLHQVLSGRRSPSRDRLLCLCFGLGAALEETQTLLRQAGYARLDPKVKRDAIILHGIVHRIGLEAVNDKLFDENEKTLY